MQMAADDVLGSTARLNALAGTGLLDTPAEEAFDRFTRLAARVLDAPLVMLTFVGKDQLYVKSVAGLATGPGVGWKPLTYSSCTDVVALRKPFISSDLSKVGSASERGQATMRSYAGVPLMTDDGHAIGSLCVMDRTQREWTARDIDVLVVLAAAVMAEIERHKAEMAIRTSEQRFRLIARATNDVVWDWDLRDDTLLWNDAIQSVFGYDATKIPPVINWWYSHIHADDRDRVVAGIHRVIDEGHSSWKDEYRYERRDGTFATVLDRGYVARDDKGKALRMIGAMTDVSARTQSEDAIRFQAQLLNAVQQAVIATNPDGCVTFWNKFAEQLYGWTSDEAMGRKIQEIIPAPFLRGHGAELMERAAEGTSWTGEFSIARKDGTSFPALLTSAPILDSKGTLRGLVGVSIDLTDRRNLEEQFRQSQKMDAVGRLAGGIAHDFNNLLTVIRLNTELLLEDTDPKSPRVEDVRQIMNAADRASALTRQLLAFSRKQILQPRVLDINKVVANVQPMLQRLIGEQFAVTSTPAASGYIVADPGQLEQVLVNLVVNARDAMEDGGRISIETANVMLDENYSSDHSPVIPGRYLMMAVSDTGTGMNNDTRERAFDPFFTTKEAGKGTGLGLATVYGIVKQSGGYVWIYSELGLGTTIKAYFPEVTGGAAFTSGDGSSPALADAERGSETILLVEDEEAVRGLASRILERQGYKVLTAGNGRDAMEIATSEASRIHLVLTDVVMPGMNGRSLVERLKAVRPRIKSLYMSGYTDDDIIRRGIVDPSRAFLQKPFTAIALTQMVRRVLDES